MNKQNRRTLIFICFLLLWFLIDTDCNLISGFIHITSESVFVKVYVRGQGNMTILETGEYIKQQFRIYYAKAVPLHQLETVQYLTKLFSQPAGTISLLS